MPARWERCVRKVRRSLRRRHRKGNPYAICSHLRGRGHSYGGYWDWEEKVVKKLGGRGHRALSRSEMYEMYSRGMTSSEAASRIVK